MSTRGFTLARWNAACVGKQFDDVSHASPRCTLAARYVGIGIESLEHRFELRGRFWQRERIRAEHFHDAARRLAIVGVTVSITW